MTPSAVSQVVRKLERHYGVKLLARTTRSLTATQEGRCLQKYAEQLLDWHDAVERDMGVLKAEPEGEVRISLPTGYSETTPLKQVVFMLRQRCPKVRLVLLESNRMADLHEEADIAIRAVPIPEEGDSVVRTLAVWKTLICASPAYLKNHPIRHARDLMQAHWLNHSSRVLLHTFRHLGLPEYLPERRTDCPDSSLVAREFARSGMGLAVLLSGDVAPFLVDGSLIAVLPDIPLPTRTIHAVTAHRAQSARVRAVLEVLTACFREGS